MNVLSSIVLTSVLVAVGCAAGMSDGGTKPQEKPSMMTEAARFDAEGNLLQPKGYRRWIYVGAPLTPNDMNNGKAAFPEFHSVYVDPESFDHWEKTGTWRDGTVVLKELVSVGSKSASSGKGYFMGDFLGLEAAVKSKQRFPDAAGNWGFFRFTDEKGGPIHAKATALPESACSSCHNAGADEDLIFSQYYPVLRAAKGVTSGMMGR
ncbi:MAG: cytochrome P460 family protein [Planctomycetes bacterium]|nr:cytochrome P460 family protein [Planctomycetota bacterium]